MQTKPKGTMEQLLPLFMQTGVGIIILLIIWLVIVNLPMLEEIAFPPRFTLTELLSAVVLTVIIGMLVSFGLRMELRLGYLVQNFPQGGIMIKQLVFLIAILIAYLAFRPIAVPYMGEVDWIYHLVFLIAFVAVLAVLGSLIYRNTEEIVEIFFGSKRHGPSSSSALLCSKCGEKNAAGTKFCSFCGVEQPQPLQCSSCGVFLKPGAKFCPGCGAASGETSPRGEVTQGVTTCASCGSALKPGASFCRVCGTKIEEAVPKKETGTGSPRE